MLNTVVEVHKVKLNANIAKCYGITVVVWISYTILLSVLCFPLCVTVWACGGMFSHSASQ